ncbi:hypothetical protein ABZX98_32795 [Streptomyces sp. NPDC002992]|uniref:hypothetical protein n=1 Tax=Streptomyces sp. NPDC002992 TaxID=3154273 RepID=UPI0033A2427E
MTVRGSGITGACGAGGVLQGQEVDGDGVDAEPFFQVSAVLPQVGALFLECLVLAEFLGEYLWRAALGLHPGLEKLLEVEVLVGEVSALHAGLDRELGDAEAPQLRVRGDLGPRHPARDPGEDR